ncbi:protein-L-isoaspartate O-methyltransferase [Emcibacter sp.]|uniref:protein-L-isoaspartate O-methyltransferase family protein n=1 Tax=Emcibacter sp. TaxID=1979954 RepID=UPI002AA6D483|nr:protein-L-isoaspartate O-methyltransferase [Emcibacter sp.]
MTNASQARSSMIEGQLRPNNINDENVIEAIASVNREKFVPKAFAGVAYVDEDIRVAEGRYLMEPMVFGRLLSEAHIKPTDLVLDIACGTGYSSAVLARLAEAVVALEEDDGLVETGTAVLAEEACDNVAVVKGDITAGLAKQGPYDLIFINGMVDDVPQTLLEQLSENGRLVCVLNDRGVGKASLVTYKDKVRGVRTLFDAAIPPLAAFARKEEFSF